MGRAKPEEDQEQEQGARPAKAGTTSEYLDGLWREQMRPLDTRPIYQWIAEEGELPNCYAVPGRFDVSLVPFVKEPLEALRDPRIREVVNMSSVQCLKTLIGEFWLLWSIENNAGPTQWLQPTDEEAREHCEERFLKLVENYPRVHRFYSSNRHEKKTTAIIFKHMWMRMEGCGLTNLQRKSVKNQMCSEVWQKEHWVPGRLKEAEARLTQFSFNSKRYIESQPWETIRDIDHQIIGDDILVAWLKYTQKRWGFRCLSCGKAQAWDWEVIRNDNSRAGLRWTSDKSDGSDISEHGTLRRGVAESIRYECVHCGRPHADDPLVRGRMMANGLYLPQNPELARESREWTRIGSGESFSVNQLCMPNIPWVSQVEDFLKAMDQARKGFDLPLKLFFAKRQARSYDAEAHGHYNRMPTITLESQPGAGQDRLKPELQHEGIVFDVPLMGVDVQQDHFWALVQYWNRNGDILTVWAGKLYTWQEVRDKQLEWKVPDDDVMIDCAHRGIEVFQHCVRNGHWHSAERGLQAASSTEPAAVPKYWLCWNACRGSDRPWFIYIPRRGRDKGKRLPLVFEWPNQWGDPMSGLRAEDPNREELAEAMRKEEIGRFCPLHTLAGPTLMDFALARRDGKSQAKLLTVRGDWNEQLNRQWHSQRKENKNGKFVYVKFRDDHLLDCFRMIIAKAFMRQILGGSEISSS